MKTASKDYLIFKNQAILIMRRIKVSIKDKSILCTKQCKHEMNTKTISEIYIYIPVNHKCLHLYQIDTTHISTHKCIYFTAYPAISVTVKVLPSPIRISNSAQQ